MDRFGPEAIGQALVQRLIVEIVGRATLTN
jgi:hypothetical protein